MLPLIANLESDGALLELRLNRPKANIINAEMIDALGWALAKHAGDRDLKAVLLCAVGDHFSFGASVEEHLPGNCAAMLRAMHGLILRILDFPLPVLVSVQGQCLGGGLEIATAGHMIFAAPDAKFGQPEIKLGVIAPAASCLLPARIGQARAEMMLLSGHSVTAAEAHAAGLVSVISETPQWAAREYFSHHLAPLSATSLRVAVKAVRADFAAEARARIATVEKLYLDQLMATHDAVEGLNAFLEKRPPIWENR